jgi:hypothetical protein
MSFCHLCERDGNVSPATIGVLCGNHFDTLLLRLERTKLKRTKKLENQGDFPVADIPDVVLEDSYHPPQAQAPAMDEERRDDTEAR